jgi:hypothetical protein
VVLPECYRESFSEEYERILELGLGENPLIGGVRSVQKIGVCWIGLLCIGWRFGGLLWIFWCRLITIKLSAIFEM